MDKERGRLHYRGKRNILGNVPLTWFSVCDEDETKIEDLKEGQTFQICQAGYNDRKLVYDKILR